MSFWSGLANRDFGLAIRVVGDFGLGIALQVFLVCFYILVVPENDVCLGKKSGIWKGWNHHEKPHRVKRRHGGHHLQEIKYHIL